MKAGVVVVGAGTVGAAIAYGLASRGLRPLVLDGGDRDFRAANANFGLVWLQSKGLDMPAYQQFTRDAVTAWPDFASELTETTGIDLQYEGRGGLTICLSEQEYEDRRAKLMRWHNQLGGASDWEMLDRDGLAKLLPGVPFGPDVAGASYGHRDGHANPLRLLAALHAGIVRKGGQLCSDRPVRSIASDGHGGFRLDLGDEILSADRVVLAAGLGTRALAAQVDLMIPTRPLRGQILVTQRIEPFLPLPMHSIRQTREGTVMIGATHEETGFDCGTTPEAAAALSAKAIRAIPALRDVTLVRQWSGLRLMTPDSHPIIVESPSHPGAFVAVCHSGVTLAPVLSGTVADAVLAGRLPAFFNAFHQGRFDVPKVA